MAEKEEERPLYILTLDDIDVDAITAISLVDFPAIEKDFMAFNNNDKNKFEFGVNDVEKKVVTGPALIPNKKIYRRDMFKGEYDVMFTEEIVEKIAYEFLEDFKQKSVTLQHELNVNDIVVFESWIITDSNNDKAKALGFDLPAGTWMTSMKINNDTVWELIKEGSIRGFSIEAFLSQTLIKARKETDKEEGILEEIIDILNKIE